MMFTYAILTLSDKGAAGEREDKSGHVLEEAVSEKLGYTKEYYAVIPDEEDILVRSYNHCIKDLHVDLVLTTGGTGLSERDITPEVTARYADKEIPGMGEAMRMKSLAITPHAMITRCGAYLKEKTLIINLPGSPKGAAENFSFVADAIPHALGIITGKDKECARS